jgi:2-dehydro-3-deoxyglucarate aldolase
MTAVIALSSAHPPLFSPSDGIAMADNAPYSGIPNRFRTDLIAGKQLIGCWSSLASPVTAEILGLAGFDWILFDGEHAPNEATTFVTQLMALKDSISAPVVRPPWNDQVMLKRLLDIGFYNFLIPLVGSAEEAKRAVAATRYPPEGMRGISVAQRSNKYGTVKDYFKEVNKNICVLVQIESKEGIDNIDAICAVDGIDGIFIGPSDFSAAVGHLGNPGHADVQAGMKHVMDRAKAHKKPIGILAPVEADARRYIEMGATFVAVGSDLGVLRMQTQAIRDKFTTTPAAEQKPIY